MKINKKISILGCGWVGQALHDLLVKRYDVVCLSHHIEKNKEAGMYCCDVLVITIPPRDNTLEILRATLENIDEHVHVIFLSSISFYKGKALVVEIESFMQKMHENVVILRLGGLMGYDRVAGKYSAGKVLTTNSQTNYVHRDDVVAIIALVIEQNILNEIFDVVAPLQCSKKEIFSQNAKKFGFKETEFLFNTELATSLNPSRLCKILDYSFIKKDVQLFW